VPSDPLAGRALDYLIGADGPQRGSEDRITETPFGVGPAARGISVAYCNLRREDGEPPAYGPYLPHDDIYRQYREGRPDPQGQGFERNIVEQLDHCKALGHTLVEQDNPDSYPLAAVMHGIALAQARGLGVIAKNPGLLQASAVTYVAHPNVRGIIVEEDCGTAAEMDALRRRAGKPQLPVWFVSYGDGRGWATRTAQAIRSAGYSNMGVTYSDEGEYESSEDMLHPLAAAADAGAPAMTTDAAAAAQVPRPPLDPARMQQTIARFGQLASLMSQRAMALPTSAATTAQAQPLSPIDKALGGQALVGLKTPLAIVAYAAVWIMQAFGAVGTATGDKATATGQVLTALIAGFGSLGVTAKFDRAFNAIGAIAALMRTMAAVAAPRPGGGG